MSYCVSLGLGKINGQTENPKKIEEHELNGAGFQWVAGWKLFQMGLDGFVWFGSGEEKNTGGTQDPPEGEKEIMRWDVLQFKCPTH